MTNTLQPTKQCPGCGRTEHDHGYCSDCLDRLTKEAPMAQAPSTHRAFAWQQTADEDLEGVIVERLSLHDDGSRVFDTKAI
ncbi:hypothetical protein [Sinomonas soli]